MRWRGLGSTVVAMAALAAGLVACGGSDGSDDGGQGTQAGGSGPHGTVRFALEDMPSTWEPWNPGDLNVVRQTYETLVRRDRSGRFTPQLATAWKQTASELRLTLRSGVTFHDGTPFDGAAVKANIEAFQKSASAAGEILSAIDGVVTQGDDVTLKLSRPAPDLLAALAEQTFMASPKALAAGTIKTDPVGTGPWRYDDGASVPGSRIVMTAFDRYWDPENVHVQRIESVGIDEPAARLSAVQTGEIDVADLDRELVDQARSSGFDVVTAPLLAYQFIVLRRTGPLADPRVREALCDGIDAAAIAKLVPAGESQLTTQRFAEGEYGHDAGVPARSYDPDKAKRLLAEARWRNVAKLVHDEAIACVDMKIMENLVYDPKTLTDVKYHGDEVGWQAIRTVG